MLDDIKEQRVTVFFKADGRQSAIQIMGIEGIQHTRVRRNRVNSRHIALLVLLKDIAHVAPGASEIDNSGARPYGIQCKPVGAREV